MSRFLTGLLASLVLLTGNAPAVAQSISGFGGGSSLATPVSTLNGGSGAALTPVIGDILAADSTTSFARIAAPAVGQVLKSNGVGAAPSWSASPSLTSLVTSGFVHSNSIYANGAGLDRSAASNGLISQAGMPVMWAPSTSLTATPDTGLSRISAGVIGVGTGAQGSVAGGLQAATLALGGATLGGNALAVTGSIEASTSIVSNQNLYFASTGAIGFGGTRAFLLSPADAQLKVSSSSFANSFTLSAPTATATPSLQIGALDAASPVAQTIKFQDVAAGTSNTAGVNATIQAPAGTGTGAGGSLIFQVAPAGSSGTAKNAWATALTIASNKDATFTGGYLTASAGYVIANNGFFGQGANGAGLRGSGADGILLLNSAENAFGSLKFGGTTSSFPAIKRNGTGIDFRLADDTDYADITAKTLTVSSLIAIPAAGSVNWLTRGLIDMTGVGVFRFRNNTASQDFTITAGASNLATFNGPIKALTTTVASLPAAGTTGRLAYVTDALAPTFLATVVGGGSVKTPVHDDGTNWVVG